MLGTINLSIFILSGLLLNITPGNDTVYILTRSISQGKKAGIYSVLGISTGAIIHTFFAAVGLSIILSKSAFAFNGIKILGALYLGYLGIQAIRDKKGIDFNQEVQKESLKKIYLQGMLTNVLNPKVALFFLSFLPQFIDTKLNYGALSFLFLGSIFITTGTIWCIFLVVSASRMTGYFRRNEKIKFYLNKITGVIYLFLGFKILTTKN